MVIAREDYKEINCIFNKRGKYWFIKNGNEGSSNLYSKIAEFFIQCNNSLINKDFDFLPEDYQERDKMEKDENNLTRNLNFYCSGIIPLNKYNKG